jgi:hypothetical protein
MPLPPDYRKEESLWYCLTHSRQGWEWDGTSINHLMNEEEHPNDNPDTNNDPQDKRREMIGGILATGLWFSIDLYFLYPEHHQAGFWLGLLFVSFQLIQIPIFELRTTAIVIALILGLVGGIGQFILPPTPLSETETHGWLVPADDTTPANACAGKVQGNALLVIFGTNAIWSGKDDFVALKIGDCTTLEVNRTRQGLGVTVDIHAANEDLISRIVRNEFHLVPGEFAYADRSADLSTLTVYDRAGKEMLYVHYANPHALDIRGKFFCSGVSVVATAGRDVVMNSKAFPDYRVTNTCLGDSGPMIFEPNEAGLG